MAETIKRIEYFYAIVEDRPGEARKLLEFCSAHSVNLINFTAFPVGEKLSQLDFVPEDAEKLKMAAQDAGIDLYGPKKAFLIQGEERLGILVEYHLRLAGAGINVRAANGTNDGRGGFGYILWVNQDDYEKAAATLGV
ncbi:MAG: hypothetical protein GY839_18290 [candidate division Zixibacteria bacterium]|nr:hypothetical protein [candidate division Zixibacteria bacterium]